MSVRICGTCTPNGVATIATTPAPVRRPVPEESANPAAAAPRGRDHLRITIDRPASSDGGGETGWGVGGCVAQYRGRTRLCMAVDGVVVWRGIANSSTKRGISHPVSAQAFTCGVTSSGFEPSCMVAVCNSGGRHQRRSDQTRLASKPGCGFQAPHGPTCGHGASGAEIPRRTGSEARLSGPNSCGHRRFATGYSLLPVTVQQRCPVLVSN